MSKTIKSTASRVFVLPLIILMIDLQSDSRKTSLKPRSIVKLIPSLIVNASATYVHACVEK